jgi:hypothetical protein
LYVLSGTTLITIAINDGIIMAADDLIHAEENGQAIPVQDGVRKVFVMDNILIGSAGLMTHRRTKYQFQDWIADFIQAHHGIPNKRPRDIADALDTKMRATLKAVASPEEQSIWKSYLPGDTLVSYIVAGYAESFKRPYICEVGAKINTERNGFDYVSKHHSAKNVWCGEDHFFRRAQNGLEPEHSAWEQLIMTGARVAESLPEIPTSIHELIASVVGLIKVEAQFNPQKVGAGVHVGLIDRGGRKSYAATF